MAAAAAAEGEVRAAASCSWRAAADVESIVGNVFVCVEVRGFFATLSHDWRSCRRAAKSIDVVDSKSLNRRANWAEDEKDPIGGRQHKVEWRGVGGGVQSSPRRNA